MEVSFYDIFVFGFRVQIMPNVFIIYDDNKCIEDQTIPDKIIKYCINVSHNTYDFKVEIMRKK
jgi:hypothetical protein